MKNTLGDYLVIVLSIFGSIASIWGIINFYNDKLNDQGVWAVIFLGCIALFYLGYNIYLISKYRKRSKYVFAFEEFNNGYSHIHSIDRLAPITKQEVYNKMLFACTSISNAFSRINGHTCSVCIKIIREKHGRPLVFTFCRDEKSTIRRKVGLVDSREDHWLSDNTDFKHICAGIEQNNMEESFYFANRLPVKKEYKNTRVKDWPPKGNRIIKYFWRYKKWTLPYKSTIVVPLVPLSTNDHNQDALRGFLCIDSPRNNAFFKEYDVEILRGLADGLYNKIDRMYDLIKDENVNRN